MKEIKRVAIALGAGFTPGVNAIIMGAAISAHRLGWQVVGIIDGFEGLLFPERYPNKGLIDLNADTISKLNPLESDAMGTASMVDPFNVRSINDLDMVEEVDMSDLLLQNLKKENIDAVIAIMMGRGLSILHKLNLKGLQSVCIPRSVENDMAATAVSFGFNSALSFTIEMLDRAKGAAKSAHRVGVIEVLGAKSGWLALQSGTAVLADAVIMPEYPCDVNRLAEHLKSRINRDRPYGLVVVAEGASFTNLSGTTTSEKSMALKKALSPLAKEEESGQFVINRSGKAAAVLSNALQSMMTEEIFPLVLGPWTRGGSATAVDRQLGLAYGSASVRALQSGQSGTMVSFMPPSMQFVPLIDSLNKVRTVQEESYFIEIARSLGIFTGE
ncbi:6-phosphofructokinase [Flavihumibacter profundi]|uniref:6-phosphofructokinase n=1 Tax=Flavihumibacter profundi TaxID=2716883 RepID=UPI001CC42EB2|nr:6-phosphofructokinase [Flavihumibacter profundi]MBZ5856955.1 6-phosphofructokinase [Flavihumibacter profundi]